MRNHCLPMLLCLLPPWSAHAETVSVSGLDSAAIAAAIDQAKPGDTVLLPAGVYRLTEPLSPRTGTRVIGAGQGDTVLEFAGEAPMVMVSLQACESVTLADLTLDGLSDPRATQGIAAYDSRQLDIRRVTVENLVKGTSHGPHGIHFSGVGPTREHGVTDSVIADCTMENIGVDSEWGAGVRLSWGSSRNQVLDCVIRDTGRGGILADNGSTDLIIRGNRVSGSGGERLGIEVWGGCDRCVIEDNDIDHWLSIGGCDECAVRRNTVHADDGTFSFCGIEAIGSRLVFTGNTVDDGQVIGLSLSGAGPKQYHYYGDNTFRRCSQWGAQLQGEAGGIEYAYLYRCRFVETTVGRGHVPYPGDEGHGFRVNGSTSHLVLEECEFSDNGRFGIQVTTPTPDSWSFIRCRVTGNAGAAMVAPPAQDALEWLDCLAEGNGSDDLPAAKPFTSPMPTASIDTSGAPRTGTALQFAAHLGEGRPPIAEVLWDLDDGIPVMGEAVEHTYREPGVYEVTAIVWDAAGRGARASCVVRVER